MSDHHTSITANGAVKHLSKSIAVLTTVKDQFNYVDLRTFQLTEDGAQGLVHIINDAIDQVGAVKAYLESSVRQNQ